MPIITEDTRRLATVETITNIRPIEGADAIEQANIRNWNVVIKRDEFREGDTVVYFEVDTALPLDDERFAFLGARGTKTVDDREYHILKTARLRGVYSQGLVLPVSAFPEVADAALGSDVTATLGLGKWEAPMPVGNGDTAGAFLTQYAMKTDSERVQNLGPVWDVLSSYEWEATEKVDGTSCTMTRDVDGVLHVSGRNWEIRDGDNTYWNAARRYESVTALIAPGEAVQCEIAGPGIQKNPLGLTDVRIFIFDYVRNRVPVPRSEWPAEFIENATPVLDIPFPSSPEEALAQVDKMKTSVGAKDKGAEGIVWHTVNGETLDVLNGRSTWKAINNAYLLKHGE